MTEDNDNDGQDKFELTPSSEYYDEINASIRLSILSQQIYQLHNDYDLCADQQQQIIRAVREAARASESIWPFEEDSPVSIMIDGVME